MSSADILRIAIIGGGPAGLGAAIALSALPNVQIDLYEKARELREVGAGINIGYNCWKVLELLGAAEDVRGPFTAECDSSTCQTRCHFASQIPVEAGAENKTTSCFDIKDAETQGVRLTFEDGTDAVADLVIGGDGIRSVVRLSLFPEHVTSFTGTTIWRTLVPAKSLFGIPNLVPETSWWHGPAGHCYFSLVDDPSEFLDSSTLKSEQMLEISCRYIIDPALDTERRFSWGIPATNERVTAHFTQYDPRAREALSRVPEGNWKEFSAFSGPRLERLVGWGKVVLLGDASHPLSGAFGSGAAFALEDGWILARAIEYTTTRSQPTISENDNDVQITKMQNIANSLEIFNEIRSPYYHRMHKHLDNEKAKVLQAKAEAKAHSSDPMHIFERALETRLGSFATGDEMNWIYGNDIGVVWQNYLQRAERPTVSNL